MSSVALAVNQVAKEKGLKRWMTVSPDYAYGRDTDRSWPPRPADPKTPWAIEWTAKVRHRSLASGMVGMETSNTRQGEEICGQECTPAPEKKKKRGGLLGRLRDITGQ